MKRNRFGHLPWKPAQCINKRREDRSPRACRTCLSLAAVTSHHHVAPAYAPILTLQLDSRLRWMSSQKKIEERETHCLFLKIPFPGTLSWIFYSLYFSDVMHLFPLPPAKAAVLVLHKPALLHAMGLALPPHCRRLDQNPGSEETHLASE